MINEAMLETLDGRYELATEIRLEMPLHVSDVTAGLIRAGVSKNTLKAYRHASKTLESWLAERVLDDRLLSKIYDESASTGQFACYDFASGRRCQIDGWSGMTLRESVRTRIHMRRRGKIRIALEGKKECNGFYRIQEFLM